MTQRTTHAGKSGSYVQSIHFRVSSIVTECISDHNDSNKRQFVGQISPPANPFLILSRKNKRLVNYSIVLNN